MLPLDVRRNSSAPPSPSVPTVRVALVRALFNENEMPICPLPVSASISTLALGPMVAVMCPFDVLNTFHHPTLPGPARWGTTGLYRLQRDRAELLVTLPPGADAAYPGLVSVESGKLVMSTYSDVAYISGQIRPMHFPEFEYKQTDSDIYIAEIEVGQV